MPYLAIKEQQIYYTHQSGPAERPTLMLIHGAGGRHTDWPAKVRFLSNTSTYALDLPGHAKSDKPGRDTIDDYADDVLAFIQAQNLQNVVLVGHSMGGAIAQTMALRQIPALAGLILVATSARLRVSKAILDNIMPNFQKAVDTIMTYAWEVNTQPLTRGFARRLLAETDPKVLHGDFRACNSFDLIGQLGSINLPTLVISGTADQMTPAKFGRRLADEIPEAKFALIQRGGHFLSQEYPDQLAAEIKRFLDQSF